MDIEQLIMLFIGFSFGLVPIIYIEFIKYKFKARRVGSMIKLEIEESMASVLIMKEELERTEKASDWKEQSLNFTGSGFWTQGEVLGLLVLLPKKLLKEVIQFRNLLLELERDYKGIEQDIHDGKRYPREYVSKNFPSIKNDIIEKSNSAKALADQLIQKHPKLVKRFFMKKL